MSEMQTEIQIGMVITPAPLHREQDEMLVQWVGQNGNQVLVAGWCSKHLRPDGKDTHSPQYSVFSCFDWGRSFEIVSPS